MLYNIVTYNGTLYDIIERESREREREREKSFSQVSLIPRILLREIKKDHTCLFRVMDLWMQIRGAY